jgi:hypothetical protein
LHGYPGVFPEHGFLILLKRLWSLILFLLHGYPGVFQEHGFLILLKRLWSLILFLLHGYPGVFPDCDCVLLLIFIISQGSCKIVPTIAHICLLWLSIVHILIISIYCNKEPTILSSQNISRAKLGLGLWCLTPHSTIFQLYRGGVLLVEENGGPGEKHDLPQVTDKPYHIMVYRVHLAWAGFELFR